jgi:hypothetical protein
MIVLRLIINYDYQTLISIRQKILVIIIFVNHNQMAGYETTSNALSFILWQLARNPGKKLTLILRQTLRSQNET